MTTEVIRSTNVRYWGVTHSCGEPATDRHYPTLHWEDDRRVRFVCDACGTKSPVYQDDWGRSRPEPSLGQQYITKGGPIDREMEQYIERGCTGPKPRGVR